MVKAVFTTKVDPTDDYIPEARYHFPRTYLRQVEVENDNTGFRIIGTGEWSMEWVRSISYKATLARPPGLCLSQALEQSVWDEMVTGSSRGVPTVDFDQVLGWCLKRWEVDLVQRLREMDYSDQHSARPDGWTADDVKTFAGKMWLPEAESVFEAFDEVVWVRLAKYASIPLGGGQAGDEARGRAIKAALAGGPEWSSYARKPEPRENI